MLGINTVYTEISKKILSSPIILKLPVILPSVQYRFIEGIERSLFLTKHRPVTL